MIVRYPNDVLRIKAQEVTNFDDDLARFVDTMLDTMYSEEGIGLAAPQLGKSVSIVVIDPFNDRSKALVLINPKIKPSGEKKTSKEGCLSIPGQTFNVMRFSHVDAAYRDLLGEQKTGSFDDLLSTVIQHEVDHLAGITLLERVQLDRRSKMNSRSKGART
jgi:peptide deformylase